MSFRHLLSASTIWLATGGVASALDLTNLSCSKDTSKLETPNLDSFCRDLPNEADAAIECQVRWEAEVRQIWAYNGFVDRCESAKKQQEQADAEKRKKEEQVRAREAEAVAAEEAKKKSVDAAKQPSTNSAPSINWADRVKNAQSRAKGSQSSDRTLQRAAKDAKSYDRIGSDLARSRPAVIPASPPPAPILLVQPVDDGIDYPPSCRNKRSYALCADVGHNGCSVSGRACWVLCSDLCNDP